MTSTTAPAARSGSDCRAAAEARARTLLLVAPLSDDDLTPQHDPLMSPILWDLGHIAHFEELWLTRNLDGPIEFVEMPGMYNPFEHPRSNRGALPLPGLDRVPRGDGRDPRQRARSARRADFDAANPLLRDGYVYHMVLQHEYQHNETILQTLQLKQGAPYTPPARVAPPCRPAAAAGPSRATWCAFPAAASRSAPTTAPQHTTTSGRAHAVDVAPFWIDVHPVTNGEFLEFIEAGGYETPEFWSEAGWRWLKSRASARRNTGARTTAAG